MPIRHLCSTIQKFVQWIDDGVYDFSSLPIRMKIQMSEDDRVTIMDIENQFHQQGVLLDYVLMCSLYFVYLLLCILGGKLQELQDLILNLEENLAHSVRYLKDNLDELHDVSN